MCIKSSGVISNELQKYPELFLVFLITFELISPEPGQRESCGNNEAGLRGEKCTCSLYLLFVCDVLTMRETRPPLHRCGDW